MECTQDYSQAPARQWEDRAAIERGREKSRDSSEGRASLVSNISRRGGVQEAVRYLDLTFWEIREGTVIH